MAQRYPKPILANGETATTPAEALECIRYLTGEWLANPATFGHWAGGCYMEQLHKLASAGLEPVTLVDEMCDRCGKVDCLTEYRGTRSDGDMLCHDCHGTARMEE